ncbi:MAG: hypothetical protein NC393_13580 [Clostridium sp.]|nr:hypothetical protein [Clostridium sp.]MCM1208214.1 hypothetical protein [Ruminococcus sp.]
MKTIGKVVMGIIAVLVLGALFVGHVIIDKGRDIVDEGRAAKAAETDGTTEDPTGEIAETPTDETVEALSNTEPEAAAVCLLKNGAAVKLVNPTHTAQDIAAEEPVDNDTTNQATTKVEASATTSASTPATTTPSVTTAPAAETHVHTWVTVVDTEAYDEPVYDTVWTGRTT